ncbi:hypothetical protein LIER_07710 [Lithospermum erythrorhizon]|uniref:Uncharacterized protein n=1 Tax=Lithospermum erythrorhizon TaxID=34254 RepID=A0AAV3PDT0_LITER
MDNTNIYVHESQQNNPPNEQPRQQYPTDIDAKIQRRVNEQLNREQERTVQSSRYTHYTRHGDSVESNEAPRRTQDNHERRSNVPAVPSQVPTA